MGFFQKLRESCVRFDGKDSFDRRAVAGGAK